MNEEMDKAISALAGDSTVAVDNPAVGDATDWKAKFEAAQKELASARVEQGRVKKLAEEKKALEKELSEVLSSRRTQELINELPEDVRGDVPEDLLRAQTEIAQRAMARALAERDEELRAIREQDAAKSRQDFALRIEQEFPGFIRSAVLDGGDKHVAWTQYQRYNAASINAAAQSHDFDTLSWHIRKFYSDELGITPPSGGTGAAAPDPSATGGGITPGARHGKAYTVDEISALFDKKEAARDRGDWAEVKRLTDEINRAQAEVGAKH